MVTARPRRRFSNAIHQAKVNVNFDPRIADAVVRSEFLASPNYQTVHRTQAVSLIERDLNPLLARYIHGGFGQLPKWLTTGNPYGDPARKFRDGELTSAITELLDRLLSTRNGIRKSDIRARVKQTKAFVRAAIAWSRSLSEIV